jgi:hypothetical protein
MLNDLRPPRKSHTSIGVGVAASAILSIGAFTVGQAQAPAATPNTQKKPAAAAEKTAKTGAPRRPDGRPDLEGTWDMRTVTPMERPNDVAATTTPLSEEDAAALQAKQLQKKLDAAKAVTTGVENTVWFDEGKKLTSNRASLIVDPSDGKFPPLTPEGQKRLADEQAAGKRIPGGIEDLTLSDRCMHGFNAGPPMNPTIYNNNVQIAQTSDYVLIVNEMNHDTRIIPLKPRPALPPTMRHWRGDPQGKWEGDTLVVETRNFRPEGIHNLGAIRPDPDENYRLTERFTRVNETTLRYRFTVDDPTVWTKPWTVELDLIPSDGLMYEFACHEGNYGLPGILRGARQDDKAAAVKAADEKAGEKR